MSAKDKLANIFGNKAKTKYKEGVVLKMVQSRGNGFYSWNGNLYYSDIVRSCIKPQVKALGKIVPKHIYRSKSGLEVNPRVNIRFLLEEPNVYMTGQMFQEKMANQLALNGNAFALIIRDSFNNPSGLYPIPCTSVEARYTEGGDLYLRFWLQNGRWMDVDYAEVIHLRDDFFSNDLFGDDPQQALASLMEVVNTSDQGIIKAVKNSAVIKWLLKFVSATRDDDLKQRAQDFADNYLDVSNNSVGVAAINSNVEATQITPTDYVPNAAQSDRTISRIQAFFGTNDKIVHSNYTENEWISYYEAKIEPTAIQMAQEYTRKLFTRKERGYGNEIVFEASPLTFASMSTKLNLVQLVDRGVMSPNEMRAYFNLAPIDGGDIFLLRKDTGVFGAQDESEDVNEDNGIIGNDSTE